MPTDDANKFLRSINCEELDASEMETKLQLVLAKIQEWRARDKYAWFSVLRDGPIVVGIVAMTKQMREHANLFSDCLFMDSIHGVSAKHLHMVSFTVADNKGHTQATLHAVVMHEGKDVWQWCMQEYRDAAMSQDGKWAREPQVIMSDNDSGIRAAAKAVWPDACAIVCWWHFRRNLTFLFK